MSDSDSPTYDELKQRLDEAESKLKAIEGVRTRVGERMSQVEEETGFLELILEQSPVPMWIGDAKGTLIKTNKALREAVRVTDEQLVGVYHPLEDPNVQRAGLTEKVRKVLENFEPARFTLLWRPEDYWQDEKGDARERHMDLFMFPIVRGGKLQNVVTQWQDITDRVQTEQKLRESEQRLSLATASAGIGTWDLNLVTDELLWDSRMFELYGLAERSGTLSFDDWQNGLHPDDREYTVGVALAAVRGEKEFDIEFRVLWPDGTVLWIKGYGLVIRDEEGKPVRMLGVNYDITERKEAENAISTERYRLASIIEGTNVATWEWNVRTGEVVFNERWAEILGYTLKEISPVSINTWEEFCHPDDFKKSAELLDKHFAGELPYYDCEARMRHKDGSWVWVHDRGRLMSRTEEGKPLMIMGTHTDITQRKLMEEQRRLEEEKFRGLFELAPVGIAMNDPETGDFLLFNKALLDSTGYTREEFGKLSVWDITPDEHKPGDEKILAQIREIGYYGPHEKEYRRKNGERFPVLLSGFLTQTVEGTAVVWSIIQDISSRKQAEMKLLRQKRSLELRNRIANVFLTSSGEKIYSDVLEVLFGILKSRYGRFGYVNDRGDLVCFSIARHTSDKSRDPQKTIVLPPSSWCGLCGQSLREQRTLMSNDLLSLAGEDALDNALVTPIVHRGTLIGQFVVGNREGGYDEESQHLLEAAAQITAPILYAVREEARQKEQNEALQAQLYQSQKIEAIGRLAGGVSHDFNNMLGVIIGHADILASDLPEDSPLREDLKEIRLAAERSVSLTRQLLAFARKQTVTPTVIDLNKTVESMLKMLKRLIGEEIEMSWSPGEEVWPLKVDPSQIDQVLANLCVNARDAIKGPGKVTIETANAVLDEDFCKLHASCEPGEYVKLVVSDNGCGMSRETQSRLFEPFFTTKKVGEGTGLGLATVYGVVKQNNGLIDFESKLGEGTTFTVYLPCYQKKASPQPKQEPVHPTEVGHETILLVEDEPSVLKLTTKVLQRQGYQVVEAATPGEAERLAIEHQGNIDLLVTDVVMPEMNGCELANRLLSLYPDLKYLFMSGYTADVIAHHGMVYEGVNFIEKPFSIKALARKVREVLDHQSQIDSKLLFPSDSAVLPED